MTSVTFSAHERILYPYISIIPEMANGNVNHSTIFSTNYMV